MSTFAEIIEQSKRNRNLRIPLDTLLNELKSDDLISDESLKLSRVILKNESESNVSCLSQLAAKTWSCAKSKSGRLDGDFLARWLAEKLDLPFYRIDSLELDSAEIAQALHYKTAKRHQVLPVEVKSETILVATTDPFNLAWLDELQRQTRKNAKVVIANPSDIAEKIEEVYNLDRFVKSAGVAAPPGSASIQNLEQLLKVNEDDADNEQNIVKIVDWMLQYAIKERASDIHIEPKRDKGVVRFRIDGMLNTIYTFPAHVNTSLTSRLKILGRMNIAEKRKPQDGRIKTLLPNGLEVELRLSTMPTTFGEKMVMRIFDPEVVNKDFSDLGFDQREIKVWRRLIGNRHGIILVTGPTGSGKTTTLYTTLRSVATSHNNVCTIEDPIEMVDPTFNQMQVHEKIGLTFSQGVRTLLRQDPDIIMVGEIRDRETAEIACQASLTGHLVFSTLHTNDTASAIIRLLELGVPYYMIKATVIGIVAQRLLRVLCPLCKTPVKTPLSENDWSTLSHPFKLSLPERTFQSVGCEKCRYSGYQGRKGIYEILEIGGKIPGLITHDANLEKIQSTAIRQGTHHLRLCGAKLLAKGITSLDEVLYTCPMN